MNHEACSTGFPSVVSKKRLRLEGEGNPRGPHTSQSSAIARERWRVRTVLVRGFGAVEASMNGVRLGHSTSADLVLRSRAQYSGTRRAIDMDSIPHLRGQIGCGAAWFC